MALNLWKWISYWYFRYLMTTELYMVENWERHIAHFILCIIFLAFMYFNLTVVVGLTSLISNWMYPVEM